MLVNALVNIDCLDGMRSMPSGCIPLTLTSPPYDQLRLYGGQTWNFEGIATELHRITMPGGVLVWVTQDQIIDGSESGTSARQMLFFKRLGFRLHQTLVMRKKGCRLPGNGRYGGSPEFAFVFSRGKPRTVNIIRDKMNSTAGDPIKHNQRRPDGTLVRRFVEKITPEFGARDCVWTYDSGFMKTTKDRIAFQHPALMHEQMAQDHILSWSNPGDLVFDPFSGAGTTLKMALLNGRNYLGMEVVGEYCEIANERLRVAQQDQGRQVSDSFHHENKNLLHT